MPLSDKLSPLSAGADSYKFYKYYKSEHKHKLIQHWVLKYSKEGMSSEVKQRLITWQYY